MSKNKNKNVTHPFALQQALGNTKAIAKIIPCHSPRVSHKLGLVIEKHSHFKNITLNLCLS